jgi:type II secretory pathway pseudopilin PulG
MNDIHTQKNISEKKGFTIVETLVAIGILLTAITGPLTFAQSGLRDSFLARDQIAAFYLAQDVIETIKNIRDNTSLQASSSYWLNDLGTCKPSNVGTTVVCNMDTAQSSVNTVICPSNICAPLYYDSVTKQYTVDSGPNRTVSKYTRTIYVTELVANQEAQIAVEVKWDSNFFSIKRIVVQENIYNWVPKYINH